MKPQTAWAIKTPEGKLDIFRIGTTRKEMVRYWTGSRDTNFWKAEYKIGYRCVEIEIREVKK